MIDTVFVQSFEKKLSRARLEARSRVREQFDAAFACEQVAEPDWRTPARFLIRFDNEQTAPGLLNS